MNRTICTFFARSRAILGRPWVLLLLVLFAFLDVASLPESSTLGQLIKPSIGRATHCYFGPCPAVIRRGGHIVVSDEFDQPNALDSEVVGYAMLYVGTVREGSWATTSVETGPRPRLNELVTLSPSEHAEFRASFGNYLLTFRQGAFAAEAAAVSAGSPPTRTPVLSGYAHNAGSIILFGALAVSLSALRSMLFLGRSPRELAAAQLALNRCPTCGYDIAGLPEARCPECGATWETGADEDLRIGWSRRNS